MIELNEDSNGSSSTTSSVFEATNKYIENNSDLLQKLHRTESRSVSNDSSASNQNIVVVDENSSSSSSTMPKLGLKLVLKRHSGDKYEVKSNNNPNSTPLSASTSLLNNTPNTDHLLSSSRRPKREAARKVKFTFSESEYDLDDIPIRKKSRQSIQDQKTTMPVVSTNHILKQQNKKQPNINYKTTTNTTTNINNNVKIVISESKVNTTPSLLTPTQPALVPQPTPPPPPPVQTKFERSDLVSCSIDDKIAIMKEQPFILIKQSKPFPIALVEDKTNVVYTKALLFLHLFKSYSSQCIYCPWCRLFLSVGEFSKHLHPEDLDEDDEVDESSSSCSELSSSDNEQDNENKNKYKKKQLKKLNKLKQKSFKILPYCTNLQQDGDDRLSESDIQTWKTFGSRFAQFKSIRNEQQKKEKELASLIRKQDDLANPNRDKKYLTIQAQHISLLSRSNRASSGSVASSCTNVSSPNPINQAKTISKIETFDDWDQIDKEKKVFYLSKGKIDYEKVTYLNSNGDRLSESEYEGDAEDIDVEEDSKTTDNKKINIIIKNIVSSKPQNDFTLSESEDDDNEKLDHALVSFMIIKCYRFNRKEKYHKF